MPELPEVEVVRAGLEPAVVGARIEACTVLDARALTRHSGTPESFERELTGSSVGAVARRGKFLWFPVRDTGRAVVAHLGMSGQMLLREPGAPVERHERIRWDIVHPEHGELSVLFVDQRTFGSLAVDDLVATADGAPGGRGTDAAAVPTQVSHIARDPLDPAFDRRRFHAELARRAPAIKRVLLDQAVVSGIGNIYADEALWAARIHPETSASSLSRVARERLLDAVVAVMTKALAEGGTSFDAQYVNVNGQAGYFAHSLEAYGRTGAACTRCGTPIVRVAFTNRSSHYCPRCQRRR
ncbi:bifunctional DNA-formamidopyrimidine glycosylase/DNA-(apurinic or apyrimidinic site) lyase [Microbacterium imperiale]|uniref:Formamidopyrimidine-DNA glycosylase n=1 Tax=Microbacterium imperiale TaxID=33884 RepID=A0A9W6M2T0_9MICO|nr:bifunctional DNA-formamidopyrimidine glycosylase/DNA-(apurinic or apyrimidinic site) lyase [Microbacterium imperiale]MBP2419602.1 formamidopyrimidine-DNA glycosylase [Microbacterium imperiale]MDS0198532.1 bifunctional DNA-formamidopyrimidine glycosylase/DNA-(apurinic or apyrimidinic site) lyase [Microbacterium imperiale]BFE39943.1 bifunctional DNA-formamidopyrimidine glycosylase/DNA-(apurinic or apyrimidinic site) lyase [Microbacterium imperiale]GLJ79082.1 formamidopyrimidine-DNA glycosylase